MAYIDCDKCYHGRVCAHRHHYHDMIVECNHHIPAAGVVEVVRCKDCKYFNKDRNECFMHSEEDYIFSPETFDFCSYGERRDA